MDNHSVFVLLSQFGSDAPRIISIYKHREDADKRIEKYLSHDTREGIEGVIYWVEEYLLR